MNQRYNNQTAVADATKLVETKLKFKVRHGFDSRYVHSTQLKGCEMKKELDLQRHRAAIVSMETMKLIKDCVSEDRDISQKAQRTLAEILSEPLRMNVVEEKRPISLEVE